MHPIYRLSLLGLRRGEVTVLTLHEAQHTAATQLAEAGVPVEVASRWLGHDPAMYLRTYVHVQARSGLPP